MPKKLVNVCKSNSLRNSWPYFRWKIHRYARDQVLGIVGLLSHYGIIWLLEYSYLSVFHGKISIGIFGITEIPELSPWVEFLFLLTLSFERWGLSKCI